MLIVSITSCTTLKAKKNKIKPKCLGMLNLYDTMLCVDDKHGLNSLDNEIHVIKIEKLLI